MIRELLDGKTNLRFLKTKLRFLTHLDYVRIKWQIKLNGFSPKRGGDNLVELHSMTVTEERKRNGAESSPGRFGLQG